jgi:phosphatidylserine/phosphatidylglycerophosphate/cardiolipin synthase-like enzyme
MDAATWQQMIACKKWGLHDGSTILRLYAPVDDIHTAMMLLVKSAAQALHCAMYGWADAELDALFREAWKEPSILVKIALDSSQAAGLGERPLLKLWPANVYTSSLVIGQSTKHRISHMKMIVADDCCLSGSTNLSKQGEALQTNEATFIWSAKMAQEAQTRISQIFAEMCAAPGCLTHADLLGGAT